MKRSKFPHYKFTWEGLNPEGVTNIKEDIEPQIKDLYPACTISYGKQSVIVEMPHIDVSSYLDEFILTKLILTAFEEQDINVLQYSIITLYTSPSNRLFEIIIKHALDN